MKVEPEEITRETRLHFNSQVLVEEGWKTEPDTPVAKTMFPLPRRTFLTAFQVLPAGLPADAYSAEWLCKAGDRVEFDQPIVRFEAEKEEVLLDWQSPTLRIPFAGVIESIHKDSGGVLMREHIEFSRRREKVPVGNMIGAQGKDFKKCLKVSENDFVERNQIIAHRPEVRQEDNAALVEIVRAPIAGIVSEVDLKRGNVILERKFEETVHRAGFRGEVTRVDRERIRITGRAFRIKGLWGMGGESFGRLKVVSEGPDKALTSDRLDHGIEGRILVGGSLAGLEVIRDAAKMGARGLITGGVDHIDLVELGGRDFSVAITGREKIPFPVIATSGFGVNPIDSELFEAMRGFEGREALIDGTTYIRAGVKRPDIIIHAE